MIITIDGPIATGKSSIAKGLAEKLGFIFFDTGAMYRCITYGIIQHKININNQKELEDFLDEFTFDIRIYHGQKQYIIEDKDVTELIRTDAVTSLVSQVAAIGSVRKKLVLLQKELAVGVNAVFEGRDMGSVVFPDAKVKVFLIGRPEVRAQRRYEEMLQRFPEEADKLTIEKMLQDINRRDHLDTTRDLSPLRQAENALVIDTSDLSIGEIVDKIIEHIQSLPA